MAKLRPIALVLTSMVLALPASAYKAAAARGSDCVVTRILPDGREIRAAMPPGLSGHASARHGRGFATSRASARASSRSAVSISSSSSASASSGGGRGYSSSVTSHTDEAGRTITMRRDGRGCTVVIDERTIGEE